MAGASRPTLLAGDSADGAAPAALAQSQCGDVRLCLLVVHRCGLAGVIVPRGNEREVDEELGRAVEVHYVARVDELLDLALEPAMSSAAPADRVS